MARTNEKETLGHDLSRGEVDPRTYPLICCVKFKTPKLGHKRRLHEINRLTRVIDEICTEEGEPRATVHYTLTPGIAGPERVEVRVQPLTMPANQEQRLVENIRTRMDDIEEAGKEQGWALLPV